MHEVCVCMFMQNVVLLAQFCNIYSFAPRAGLK